jgi:hypothetical protein
MRRLNAFAKFIGAHAVEIRVALLIILLVVTTAWAYLKEDEVRQSYQRNNVSMGSTEEVEARKDAAKELLKQSDQFQGWSVLILGGIVAVLVTTKVHRTPNFEWAYLPLGPAAVLLAYSLHVGWVVAKRYTFLVGANDFTSNSSLSSLVQLQSDLFLYSILCVSLFASWFLFLIVLGRVEPFEDNKENKS